MVNRKFRTLLLSTCMICSSMSCASETDSAKPSGIPLSVDELQTYRVGKNLVRLIRHNMELMPRFDIELLETPELEIIHSLSITEVSVGNETLDFQTSEGVFIENFGVVDSAVEIEFDYFYTGGGSDMVLCKARIEAREIAPPVCKVQ